MKFTPNGGHIAVLLEQQADSVVLTVRDTGPGIASEHLPHVFDRFYQVDETNTRAQPGTGIGLSLVKELVKLHGGTIDVGSNSGGNGAAFTVRIPLQPVTILDDVVSDTFVADLTMPIEPPRTEVSDGDEIAEEDLATLLVVDDSADLRAYVREHFAARFRVIEAGDGEAGVALARKHVPDLIVSNVMMPGTDGHELVRRLRGSADTDFIPIVLLTAQATSEHRIAGLERGADDYVAKPFEMRELEARIDNLIAARRRLREHYAAATVQLKAKLPEVHPRDQALLERVRAAIEQHIGDAGFGVAELASAVFQDRSHLYRRIRELVGETPSDLIRRVRLEHARRLLAGRPARSPNRIRLRLQQHLLVLTRLPRRVRHHTFAVPREPAHHLIFSRCCAAFDTRLHATPCQTTRNRSDNGRTPR